MQTILCRPCLPTVAPAAVVTTVAGAWLVTAHSPPPCLVAFHDLDTAFALWLFMT